MSPYVKQPWVDSNTPVDAVHMTHIEDGIAAVEAGIPAVPAVVNGKWLKGVAGAMVWSDITPADVIGAVLSGTRAARPTAAAAGRGARYYETDWLQWWSSDGAAWTRLGYASIPRVASAQLDALVGPLDGDEILLTDNTANPTYVWRFRYSAGSSSAYKWEFVGGWEVVFYDAAQVTIPTAGWGMFGPVLTAPRPGVYNVRSTSLAWQSGQIAGDWVQSNWNTYPGNAAIAGSPTVTLNMLTTATGDPLTLTNEAQLTLAVGTFLLAYAAAVANTFSRSRMSSIVPVRIS